MHLIEKVLSREEFSKNPPILVDVGASGAINSKWKKIAKFSICIAFDADAREFGYIVSESSTYKKLYTYNSLVAEEQSAAVDFYLTRSPYCSSLLEPDIEKLKNWSFSELFEIKELVKLKTIDLKTVLKDIGIDKIDWFKTDSQGTDLRLFKSLGEELIHKTLVAEFEPGIIDAYKGEDKLYSLMNYMQGQPFWMSKIVIQGSQRISQGTLKHCFNTFEKKHITTLINTSPGWGEVTYFNSFSQNSLEKRDFLLGWVFSVVEGQYGFALELLHKAEQKFDDPVFDELKTFTLNTIKSNYYKIVFYYSSKIINKLKKMLRHNP